MITSSDTFAMLGNHNSIYLKKYSLE